MKHMIICLRAAVTFYFCGEESSTMWSRCQGDAFRFDSSCAANRAFESPRLGLHRLISLGIAVEVACG